MKLSVLLSTPIRLAVVCALAIGCDGQIVRSWSNQTGGDLWNSSSHYSFLRQGVFPGMTEFDGHRWYVDGTNNRWLDQRWISMTAFLHGVGGKDISGNATEQAAMMAANRAGVCFIIEADSDPSNQALAQAMINALGQDGPVYTGKTGGSAGANASTFVNAGISTDGPWDTAIESLVGGSFGSFVSADIDPVNSTVIGVNGAINTWVEWRPCPTCGLVMVLGAPYGYNTFMRKHSVYDSGDYYNPNNWIAFRRFLAGCTFPADLSVTVKDDVGTYISYRKRRHTFTYNVKVTNDGPNDADNVKLDIRLPLSPERVVTNVPLGNIPAGETRQPRSDCHLLQPFPQPKRTDIS